LKKKVKILKVVNILKTAGYIAKSSKFQSKALLLGVQQGMISGLKLYQKKILF